MDESAQKHSASVSQDKRDEANSEPVGVPTVRSSPRPRQTMLKRSLGMALFPEGASLVLHIEGSDQPLVLNPPPISLLGRQTNRDPHALVIDLTPYAAHSKGVSRLHAVLHRSKITIAIEDMNSTNGTTVNGQQLPPHQSQVLHNGDEIWLGSLQIQIAFQG